MRNTEVDIQHLANLLLKRSTNTAFGRLLEDAKNQKQSVYEIAYRRASNILRSMSLRQTA